MNAWRTAGAALGACAISLAAIALAPVVLLAGEAVNRHYLQGARARPVFSARRMARRGYRGYLRAVRVSRLRGSPATSVPAGWLRVGVLPAMLLSNPAWIALTAPARWLTGLLRPLAGHGRRRGGSGPPPAGVREPRRPRPGQPAGAMALPGPRQFR